MLDKATKTGNLLIRIITSVLIALFLTYSLFTLWDMYRTEIRAFASYDLLKYRPDIEHDEPPYLDELLEINPDTAAWLTIYGTNIDYPVMQSTKNDMEYLNKTATGEYSVAGSIFMSTLNHKDFSDPYNLVYGHHLANGSMFGDIEKFSEEKFFKNEGNARFREEEGVLIMQNTVYNLHVLAYLDTDAYNQMIYRADKTDAELAEFLSYIKDNSIFYNEPDETVNKVLALSTCDMNYTDGRMVLICRMELRTDPLPTREAEPLTVHRKAVGHPMAGAYWALLNLACVITAIICVLRAVLSRERISMLKQKNRRTALITTIQGMLLVTSLLMFILTEDMHKPIQIADAFTPFMILQLFLIWLLEKTLQSRISDNNDRPEQKERRVTN